MARAINKKLKEFLIDFRESMKEATTLPMIPGMPITIGNTPSIHKPMILKVSISPGVEL